jgi:hypothetical protein
MKEQKAAALRFKNASMDYAILAREVDTNRQLYDNVLQRMKETGVAAELRSSNVLVVDKAMPQRRPSSPKITQSLLLAALLGLMGGVGVVFLREHLDDTLKSLEEAERYLRLPTLGLVPDLLKLDWGRHVLRTVPYLHAQIRFAFDATEKTHATVSSHSLLVMMEATAHCARQSYCPALKTAANTPFTSAIRGEGKTTTTVNTAIVLAQTGRGSS